MWAIIGALSFGLLHSWGSGVHAQERAATGTGWPTRGMMDGWMTGADITDCVRCHPTGQKTMQMHWHKRITGGSCSG